MSRNTSKPTMNYIHLTSIGGSVNTYEATDLARQLGQTDLTLFGFKLGAILRARRELLKAGLPIELSEEDVIAFFDYLKRQGVLANGCSEDKE